MMQITVMVALTLTPVNITDCFATDNWEDDDVRMKDVTDIDNDADEC